jgi:hypothetical protein
VGRQNDTSLYVNGATLLAIAAFVRDPRWGGE